MPQKEKKSKKKSGRRGNNEGSIYQRKDERWVAQVLVGHKSDGKPLYKYAYGDSRQEVAKKLTELTHQVFENGYSSFAASESHLFYPLMEEWYLTFKEPTVKSRTSEKLRGYMKNHIKPEFGKLEVEQIDTFRLQRFFNGMLKRGTCMTTVQQIKQLMNQFYKEYILKMKLVHENPLDDVKIKSVANNDQDRDSLALTPELRSEVFEKLKDYPMLRAVLVLFILTGLRPGELLALKWKDIDLDNSTISIKLATSVELTFDDTWKVTSRKQVISNTKTALSVRSFVLSESAVECLREWKKYLSELQMKTGVNYVSGDCFVYATQKGTMYSYGGMRSMLIRFLQKTGLDDQGINFYTFRHTFATMLLEERENPKIVSELMGHARVTTTLSVYSHIINKSVYEVTAKTLDSAFRRATEQKKTDEPSHDSSAFLTLLPTGTDRNFDRDFDSDVVNLRQF